MSYKRLTKYSKENQDYITPFCDTANCNGVCVDCDYEQVIINRLAEFENELEGGKLVRLPCKVGDGFFAIVGKSIREYEIEYIKICKKNKVRLISTENISFDLGEDCFLTDEEAKKKLKELRND